MLSIKAKLCYPVIFADISDILDILDILLYWFKSQRYI